LYFALLAGRHIAIPGLYCDEVLFVNAATRGTSHSFVSRRIFGVPVMLMSYIGALKAYLYFPIFKLLAFSRKYKTASYINFSHMTFFLHASVFRLKK
jgi:hypothetical protein